MKKYLYLFAFIFSGLIHSQSSGITYQAVIYNPGGEELPGENNMYAPLTEQDICLRFNFIDSSGGLEYQEVIQVTTDVFGMVNVIIGNDVQTGGYADGFNGIVWDGSAKNLMVEVDVKGNCSDYDEISNQPFTYIPFAYYSANPGNPGADGQDGLTAYQIWISLGNTGTEQEFMDSLSGSQGEEGEQGIPGIGADGLDGLSAYQVWISLGNNGTEQEFMESLVGPPGIGGDGLNGLSAYEVWISLGNTGTEQEFIDSLVGTQGEQGLDGTFLQGDNPGDILFLSNSEWTILPIGSEGDILTVSEGFPSWSPQATDAPPIITLIGENPQLINIDANYVELGATAYDEADGDITSSIVIDSSLVDTSVVGSYNVTYTVTDSSGNIVMAIRQVSVNPVDSVDPCDNGEIQNYCDIDVDEINFSGTVTDIDGNTYNYISYNSTEWTVDDASMVTYRDGTPIPYVYGYESDEWNSLTTGAWQYENDDPTLNKIYNAYAAAGVHDNDPSTPNKELAPEGWHVPTLDEWSNLVQYVTSIYGDFHIKALASSTGWACSTVPFSPGYNQSTNNCSGFNAKPKIVPANYYYWGHWWYSFRSQILPDGTDHIGGSYGFNHFTTNIVGVAQSSTSYAAKMRFVKD